MAASRFLGSGVEHKNPHLRYEEGRVTLPGKGNSNSHGARPVHLIITMLKWILTSRLSIKNSCCLGRRRPALSRFLGFSGNTDLA